MIDKDRTAARIANFHYEVEPGITKIFRLLGNTEAEAIPKEPIKLLEVHQNTIPTETLLPLQFGPEPSSGIDYPSVILEVTPEEFERIESGQLELPKGWVIGDLYPRPPECAASSMTNAEQ